MTVDTEVKQDIVDTTMIKDREQDTTYVNLDDFDIDIAPLISEENTERLAKIGREYIDTHGQKASLGVVTERAQPPTPGHIHQILAALEVAEHVALILGSANPDINNPNPNDEIAVQRDMDNPFPPEERQFLIEHVLKKIGEARNEDLLSKVSFVPVNDFWHLKGKKGESDDLWKEEVMNKVAKLGKGPIRVAVANDDWVRKIFGEDVPVTAVPYFEKTPGVRFRGTDERDLLRKPQGNNPPRLAPRGRHRFIQAHL
jgi:nicotinamide mononucleotide adenylyltransferase